ncbi:hypothetical protein CRYUN_Cryun12cG0151100 [Craigia yunnanensis]
MHMAPTSNRPSPNDVENFFRNVNYSRKSHCQEAEDDDEFASTETKQRKSYETKLREDLKELLVSNSFAGLVTEACSKATRIIFTRMDTQMKRGGRVQLDGDKTEKQRQLPNQLSSNLEFWLFYACI